VTKGQGKRGAPVASAEDEELSDEEAAVEGEFDAPLIDEVDANAR
jgi:hypothetical protein